MIIIEFYLGIADSSILFEEHVGAWAQRYNIIITFVIIIVVIITIITIIMNILLS